PAPTKVVLSHFEFEGFRTVMPALRLRSGQAPAGIQGDQAAAFGYSAWIPAFAGMTQHSSTPHNHHDRLVGFMADQASERIKKQIKYETEIFRAALSRRSRRGIHDRL